MAQWEHIRTTVRQLQHTLHAMVIDKEIEEEDIASMSSNTINDMLSLHRMLNSHGYVEDERIQHEFIEYYLTQDVVSDEKKLDLIMSRSSGKPLDSQIDLNKHKKYIISVIPTSPHIRRCVVEGKLEFDYADLKELGVDFVKKLASDRYLHTYKNKCKGCSDDDEDECRHIKVSHVERLVVNCLALFHEHLDSGEVRDLMQAYMGACDPRRKHFPVKFTRIDGELLSGISYHYNVAHDRISPLIKTRRNVEVIIDNKLHNHYTYNAFTSHISKHGYVALGSITIEFPYMCYAYVHRVEVDYLDDDVPSLVLDNTGSEYVMSSATTKMQDTSVVWSSSDVQTVIAERSNNFPAVYVVVRNGHTWDMNTMLVKEIRLYGSAVTFV